MGNSVNWINIGSIIDIIFNGIVWFIIGLCLLPIIDKSDEWTRKAMSFMDKADKLIRKIIDISYEWIEKKNLRIVFAFLLIIFLGTLAQFEIITETIAFVLLIIGYIIYFSIYVLNFVWYLISQFGFYNVIVILSWSYLIGLYRYIYSKIFEFINARKLKKQIKHAEKNIDLLVENENQEPGYTKKT